MPPDERDDEHAGPLGPNDDRSETNDETAETAETTEPQRGFGVRIAFYLLITLFVLWAGSLALLVALEGTEATKEMLRRAAEGDELALSTVLAFWLQVATAPLVVAVTWAFVRSDGTSLAHLGLRRPHLAADETGEHEEADPATSAALGALGVASALLVVGAWRVLAAQWAEFRVAESFAESELGSMGSWLPMGPFDVLLFAGGFLVSALVTELIFRGYVFTKLRRRLPWVHAAGISALFFTLFQPTDDAVLAPSLLNLFLLGMLFAALREATGSLWPAAAFHATWNLLIATVLSLPLSGWILPRLQAVEMQGPEWVTGGGFGPEGSWLMTAFLVPAVLAAAAWMGDVDGVEGTASQE